MFHIGILNVVFVKFYLLQLVNTEPANVALFLFVKASLILTTTHLSLN